MTTRFIAVVLAAVLTTAGVLAFSTRDSASVTEEASSAPVTSASPSTTANASSEAYVDEFKAGYADGFGAGVAGFSYPDQSSMASSARGYLEGFGQGYTDGQSQQAGLRNELCFGSRVSGVSVAPASGYVTSPRYARANDVTSTRSRGYYESRPVDRGLSTGTRRALMVGAGAATGAGLGAALGGRKGAAIGALVGGGTGTVLAVTKKPTRAYNRRVTGKSVATHALIGAGAGAAIGGLTRGGKGALAGAALGGGGGAIWSLMTGERTRR